MQNRMSMWRRETAELRPVSTLWGCCGAATSRPGERRGEAHPRVEGPSLRNFKGGLLCISCAFCCSKRTSSLPLPS